MVTSLFLLVGIAAFALSGLLLGASTYLVFRDRDWRASKFGVALTGVCILGAFGLFLLFWFHGSKARAEPLTIPILRPFLLAFFPIPAQPNGAPDP